MRNWGIIVICLIIIIIALTFFMPEGNKISQLVKKSNDSEGFATWREFQPRSGLFKVRVPHDPQYAKDFVDIPGSDQKRRYDLYASEKIDGTLFLVSVITYPSDVDTSNTSEILKQTLAELRLSRPDNQITNEQEGQFQNHPDIDFTMNNKEFHIEGKTFMDGKIVYVISYVAHKDTFDPGEYQHFIDSFKLQKN